MDSRGCLFAFDGTLCDKYDLMLYEISGSSDFEEGAITGVGSVIDESLPNRWRPLLYGITYEEKLTFQMTFGANERRMDSNKPLSRNEISEITKWLAGHDSYKPLIILQDGFVDREIWSPDTIYWDPDTDPASTVDLGAIQFAYAANYAPRPEVFTKEGFSYTLSTVNATYVEEVEKHLASGYTASLTENVYLVGDGIAAVALTDNAYITTDTGTVIMFPKKGMYFGCTIENGVITSYYSKLTSPRIDHVEPRLYDCFVFKAMVTELTIQGNMDEVWALTATITCDSPFAYKQKKSYVFTAADEPAEFAIENTSNLNQNYEPIIRYTSTAGGDLEIINTSDSDRIFKFTAIPPAAANPLVVDNENYVISNSADLNLYEKFNYKFFRLVPGSNILRITGNGTIEFECEYPVNIGGYISA